MQEDFKRGAPAASGWGSDFLKQNAAAQASQSAALAQEIAEKRGGAAQPASPSPGKASAASGNTEAEAEPAPSKAEPVGPTSCCLLCVLHYLVRLTRIDGSASV